MLLLSFGPKFQILFCVVLALAFHQSLADTKKMEIFLGTSILDKPVTDVPGIGKAMAEYLEKLQIIKAEQLLGQYLLVNRMEGKFKVILDVIDIPEPYASQVHDAMKAYTEKYLASV